MLTLRVLNPPKSLHFNWSLLSSCENTAVSWKNESLQNWRSRRAVSSNPHLQILPYPCCEDKFRFLWHKRWCWPLSPKDTCVTSWAFGAGLTEGWLLLRCTLALPVPDACGAAWRELTCCLARKRQGCLAKRKSSQDLVCVVCKCFCVKTWGEDVWVLHQGIALSWAEKDSEHAVLQEGTQASLLPIFLEFFCLIWFWFFCLFVSFFFFFPLLWLFVSVCGFVVLQCLNCNLCF